MDDEFWLRYLRAHADARTRRLHVAGTTIASLMLAMGILRGRWRMIAASLVCGYGPAWAAHALIEHNKPETFRAPFASLAADYRMAYLIYRGKLDGELLRAGVTS